MHTAIENKNPEETKVVVAMSGGVDSSTVAALLHEQGYEVVGVTLQLYDYQGAMKKGACCAGQDIYDAKMVAEKLGIPHYVLDYETIFKQEVMENFADSYLHGETPIPCVKCNQSVKFRDLFKVAKDLGADALATGHYVRRISNNNVTQMHQAVDPAKDQSYFLFATTRTQLDYLYFPLGGMSKEETRKHAERFELPVAEKPDSQDICFVPEGGYAKVVERLRPGSLEAGDIVNLSGKVIGKHNGVINYTVGQRRGLGISHSEPLYVIRIDPENNRIIVGGEKDLYSDTVNIKELNWLGDGEKPTEGAEIKVKLRSTQTPVEAKVSYVNGNGSGTAKLTLNEPQTAITPGQACVMYDETRCLGGGWIVRDFYNA